MAVEYLEVGRIHGQEEGITLCGLDIKDDSRWPTFDKYVGALAQEELINCRNCLAVLDKRAQEEQLRRMA